MIPVNRSPAVSRRSTDCGSELSLGSSVPPHEAADGSGLFSSSERKLDRLPVPEPEIVSQPEVEGTPQRPLSLGSLDSILPSDEVSIIRRPQTRLRRSSGDASDSKSPRSSRSRADTEEYLETPEEIIEAMLRYTKDLLVSCVLSVADSLRTQDHQMANDRLRNVIRDMQGAAERSATVDTAAISGQWILVPERCRDAQALDPIFFEISISGTTFWDANWDCCALEVADNCVLLAGGVITLQADGSLLRSVEEEEWFYRRALDGFWQLDFEASGIPSGASVNPWLAKLQVLGNTVIDGEGTETCFAFGDDGYAHWDSATVWLEDRWLCRTGSSGKVLAYRTVFGRLWGGCEDPEESLEIRGYHVFCSDRWWVATGDAGGLSLEDRRATVEDDVLHITLPGLTSERWRAITHGN